MSYLTSRLPDTGGQVKLNSSGVGAVKPTITGLVANQAKFFLYNDTPLNLSSFPTTKWPSTVPSPTDDDLILPSNKKVIENPLPGQGHLWRFQVMFSNKALNDNLGLVFGLYNSVSGFITSDLRTLPSGTTSNPNVDFSLALGQAPGTTIGQTDITFLLYTVADSASIGIGYFPFVASTTTDNNLVLTLQSTTRVSLQD